MLDLNLELLNLLAKALQRILFLQNLIEKVKSENRDLRAEVQQLRDENNRLKGEQAKPNIKPNKKNEILVELETEPAVKSPKTHYSSESQRQKESPNGSRTGSVVQRKRSKRDQVKIDREVVLDIDRQTLPADVQFKGYQEVIVQDIKIQTDNVRFKKAKYYQQFPKHNYLSRSEVSFSHILRPILILGK